MRSKIMNERCAKCGSHKIVPDAEIQDQGSDGTLKAKIDKTPYAIFFKGRVQSKLIARICGQCGYTELYVKRPEAIYEAYRERTAESGSQ
jgi:predicted nucleic-acid-binding Zn-ribbon protein